eukprot:2329981-Pyramimonas_sp.AAC.1
MADTRNPGFSKPTAATVQRAAKKRKAVGDPSLSPGEKERAMTLEKVTEAVNIMKTSYDKVQKDLGMASLVEAKLQEKKRDTTGPVKYLKAESKKVDDATGILKQEWIEAKKFLDS